VYLTCSNKLTSSQLAQLSPPQGTNRKLKCETPKPMSVIGPVQSHCHESSPVGESRKG